MDHQLSSSPLLMTTGYPNFAVPDYDILRGCLFDAQFAGDPIPAECMFDGHVPMAAPDMVMMRGDDAGEFDYYNDDDCSDKNPTGGKKKHDLDRSRTLVSERRRRHCMKEKLYALRSLVPNITKMDKASIVGDAAAYVEQLQMQAKKLVSEIGCLETSLMSTCAKYQGLSLDPNSIQPKPNLHAPCRKMIVQVREPEQKPNLPT